MPSIPRPYDLVAGVRESAEASRWQQVQQAIRGRIEAHSITANEIEAGTITATELAANSVTADKLNVTQLSAISEDVGNLKAGTISMADGGNIHVGNLYIDASGFYVYGSTAAYGLRSTIGSGGRDIGFVRSFWGGPPNGSTELGSILARGTDPGSSSVSLHVYYDDDAGSDGTPAGYFTLLGSGALIASDTTISTSDRRVKRNIRDLGEPLDAVMALRPRRYVRKASGDEDAGFIAQELEKAMPELVHHDAGGHGHSGIKYAGLHAYTVGAIQELADRVAKLEKR